MKPRLRVSAWTVEIKQLRRVIKWVTAAFLAVAVLLQTFWASNSGRMSPHETEELLRDALRDVAPPISELDWVGAVLGGSSPFAYVAIRLDGDYLTLSHVFNSFCPDNQQIEKRIREDTLPMLENDGIKPKINGLGPPWLRLNGDDGHGCRCDTGYAWFSRKNDRTAELRLVISRPPRSVLRFLETGKRVELRRRHWLVPSQGNHVVYAKTTNWRSRTDSTDGR